MEELAGLTGEQYVDHLYHLYDHQQDQTVQYLQNHQELLERASGYLLDHGEEWWRELVIRVGEPRFWTDEMYVDWNTMYNAMRDGGPIMVRRLIEVADPGLAEETIRHCIGYYGPIQATPIIEDLPTAPTVGTDDMERHYQILDRWMFEKHEHYYRGWSEDEYGGEWSDGDEPGIPRTVQLGSRSRKYINQYMQLYQLLTVDIIDRYREDFHRGTVSPGQIGGGCWTRDGGYLYIRCHLRSPGPDWVEHPESPTSRAE